MFCISVCGFYLLHCGVVSQMDKDGCVPLDIIARFNRVRALTQDVGMIKEVL